MRKGRGKCRRNELRKPCQSAQADEPFGVGDKAEAGAVGEASTTSIPPISARMAEIPGIGSPSERAITIQLGPTSMVSKPSYASATASWKPAVGSGLNQTFNAVGGMTLKTTGRPSTEHTSVSGSNWRSIKIDRYRSNNLNRRVRVGWAHPSPCSFRSRARSDADEYVDAVGISGSD